MKVQLTVDLTSTEVEELIKYAIVHCGFARYNPRLRWKEIEKKEAVRVALAHKLRGGPKND